MDLKIYGSKDPKIQESKKQKSKDLRMCGSMFIGSMYLRI